MDTRRIGYFAVILLSQYVVASREINIGVLLPQSSKWSFSIPHVRPALEVALEEINQTNLLNGIDIRIRYADSQCSARDGMNEAIQFYFKEQVHVYFGPCCDYAAAAIARQLPFWNVPMVTAGAMAQDFGREKMNSYNTLTRIGANFNSLAQFVIDVLEKFNWKKVKLIYDPHGLDNIISKFCHLAVAGILDGIEASGKNITHDYIKFSDPSEIKLESEIGAKFGVVMLCASPDSIRTIMLKAAELNFDNGEYVFFNIDLFSSKSQVNQPWLRDGETEEQTDLAQHAYESLMTVTLRKPEGDKYKTFSSKVKQRAMLIYGNSVYDDEEVNTFVGSFYDAIFLYAQALNETLEAGTDPINGAEITKRMWNRTFDGITGTVSIDENGDRSADYSLLNLNPKDKQFEIVANYYGKNKVYEAVPEKVIHWAGGLNHPPKDTPDCGFDGSRCPGFPMYFIVIIILGLLLLISLLSSVSYSKYQKKIHRDRITWLVRYDEIEFENVGRHDHVTKFRERYDSKMNLLRKESDTNGLPCGTISCKAPSLPKKHIYIDTGLYKRTLVAIKRINRSNITLTKSLKLEFRRLKDIQHDNIIRFIGVSVEYPSPCILTEYCPKGSLRDVLKDERVKLDATFKFYLMQDIERGLSFIHGSDIRAHGNLKSSNCLVDSRFGVKLADFGIHSLRYEPYNKENADRYYHGKLWTAPELLRLGDVLTEGTQKGDIYSFAIVCQEIVCLKGPFFVRNMQMAAKDICFKVMNGQWPYLRPSLDDLNMFSSDEKLNDTLSNMIEKCWAEDPVDRPDCQLLKIITNNIAKGSDSDNILDSLISRMEQYADNLESLVEKRTDAYKKEKKRAENLLYRMLPQSVASELMQKGSVTAETFETCTIYFSDIVGFTKLSANSTPMEVVNLLNALYTEFDSVIDCYDCYKVETIGDAYMVVSGIPIRNGDSHAQQVARVSLGLLNVVKSFKIPHLPDDKLQLRIGIHSGPAVAGVVGDKMPRYCLFGDTVNTASRMESNGEPLRIHVSPFTKDILDTFGTFKLELRGPVEMKGKGKIITWWLLGEDHPDHPDFAPTELV